MSLQGIISSSRQLCFLVGCTPCFLSSASGPVTVLKREGAVAFMVKFSLGIMDSVRGVSIGVRLCYLYVLGERRHVRCASFR